MALYPTSGGSAGTWGTETRAFHEVTKDLATGLTKNDVNGTPATMITKYFTGTTDNDTSTSVAHGVSDFDNIVSVSAHILSSATGRYYASGYADAADAAESFRIQMTTANILLSGVGANLRQQKYRVKIEYLT